MDIVERIQKDDGFAVGALMALYQQQTLDEQNSHSTRYNNGVGFNAVDAPILTSMARFYKERQFLSRKQLEILRRVLPKYKGQLASLGVEPLPVLKGAAKPSAPIEPKMVAGLRKDGKAIVVKFRFPKGDPRFQETLARVKSLAGRRFMPEDKSWHCLVSLDNAEKLKGWGFEFLPQLSKWYERTTNPELPEVEVKGLGGELMPFQKHGVAFIESRKGRVLIGDEMGLGKTVQALAWLQLHPELRPALVVCPAAVKLNWLRETEKWLNPKPKVVVLQGRIPYQVSDADILIINYDILQYWFKELRPKVLVLDEVHYTKNSKAQRTKAVRALVRKTRHVIALSGTPIVNRPVEFFNCLNFLRPDLWPSFWEYAKRYCGAAYNGYGWDFKGATNTEELHKKVTRTIMLRRTKEQVLKDLPPKRRAVVPMEIDNWAEYRRIEEDFLTWLLEKGKSPEQVSRTATAQALSQIEHLKQAAVRGKLPMVVQWVRDFLDSNGKLVVFATHHFTIDALMKEFAQYRPVKLDGRDSLKQRQKAIDRFQKDDSVRIAICNMKAAGVGITLTAASNVVFVEFGWTPGDHDQAEDRVHRIGQQDSVTAWYLVAAGTVEEDIAELLDTKREVLNRVLDGKETEEETLLTALLSRLLEK